MKRLFSLLLIVVSFASYAKMAPVNSLIGDQGFIAIMGHYPHANSSENLRVKCHLLYVEYLLRNADTKQLSKIKKKRRNRVLNLLHQYALAGKYPKNEFINSERKPCFIDADGTICAVGYLLESTRGREVAEAVNSNYQYAEIYEMDRSFIEDWAHENGLTLEECALIQPSYEWVPNYQRTLSFSVGSSFRLDKSYYSKFELAYAFNYLLKKRFRSAISLQLTPLRDGNYSTMLSYYKSAYIRGRLNFFGGIGGEFFAIDQRSGWNLVPEIGTSYQYIRGRTVFNAQLAYGYHIGLQNAVEYTPSRNEVSLNIGLGFRL